MAKLQCPLYGFSPQSSSQSDIWEGDGIYRVLPTPNPKGSGDKVTLQWCGTGIHLKSPRRHSAPIRHTDNFLHSWTGSNRGMCQHWVKFSIPRLYAISEQNVTWKYFLKLVLIQRSNSLEPLNKKLQYISWKPSNHAKKQFIGVLE